MKKTRIFKLENIIKYVETRLFGENVRSEDVETIVLYQGFLKSQVEKAIGKDYTTVKQKNPREQIMLDSFLNLSIPEWSFFDRARRYERMIKVYLEETGKNIPFITEYPEQKERIVMQAYSNLAYDFVSGLFIPESKHETRRIFPEHDCKDIFDIIIGPLKNVAKQADRVISTSTNEYLDAQIVEIAGKKVLNIGYVYGGQAGLLFDKILHEINGLNPEKEKTVNIYMFGRVGSLLDDSKRHDLLYPIGVIDQLDLEVGNDHITPFTNSLATTDTNNVINLNVVSVIDETYELLESAKSRDYQGTPVGSIDMEVRSSIEAVRQAKHKYWDIQDPLNINYGFIGHVSDVPLIGDKIDEELDSDIGEKKAVRRIVEYIKGGINE
ncbi:MAG: hypothetical protein ACMXYG_07610 [Candidatus Woesearchaeota archaeon]